jgi:hypothetical protein
MTSSTRSDNAATSRTTVTKVKRFAIAMLAAATVTVGALAAPPEASAMPRSCTVSLALAQTYYATGHVFFALGDWARSSYWYGKADALVEACS